MLLNGRYGVMTSKDVLQDLVFGGKNVMMHMKADMDVEVETALGEFKVRKIPAEGEVPVKRRS